MVEVTYNNGEVHKGHDKNTGCNVGCTRPVPHDVCVSQGKNTCKARTPGTVDNHHELSLQLTHPCGSCHHGGKRVGVGGISDLFPTEFSFARICQISLGGGGGVRCDLFFGPDSAKFFSACVRECVCSLNSFQVDVFAEAVQFIAQIN